MCVTDLLSQVWFRKYQTLLSLALPRVFPVPFSRPLCLQCLWALDHRLWRGTNSFFLPQVDTASEVEELEVDSISLLPAASEGNSGGARIQVFLARYRWVPLAHSATLSVGMHRGQVWAKMDTPGHSGGWYKGTG